MTNWATLRPFILQRIVNINRASIIPGSPDHIDLHISYLRLNQVCQHWRDVISGSVNTCAILLCSIPTADQQLRYKSIADFDELASRGIYLFTSSSHTIILRTNIPHIVQSKNSFATTELLVSSRGCSIDFLSLGAILQLFGFSSAKWYSLIGVCFLEYLSTTEHYSDTKVPILDDSRIRLSNSSQYFIKHIPYVKYLWHYRLYGKLHNPPPFPLGELIDFYLPRLQTLELLASALPVIAFKHFPQYLTSLGLTISNKSSEYLPKIFAPSLHNLWLYYTNTVHYWDIFRGSLPGSVVFGNLESLTICHLYANYSLAENTDAYLSRISFPKLKSLRFDYYPFRDSSALTIFKNIPLQGVTIHDRIDKFNISALSTFRNVQSLHISISTRISGVADQLLKHIAKDLFSKPYSVRNMELCIHTSLPILLPGTILWTRLEKLAMQFPVFLSDITTILPKLPLLRWLLVGTIYCTESASTDYRVAPIWSSTITQLILFSSVVLIPTVPSLDAMCTLVSGLPFLLKLVVPDDMVSTTKDAFSERTIGHSSSEVGYNVIGYHPDRTKLHIYDDFLF